MIDPFAGRVDGFGQTYADVWAKAERKHEERKMSDARERWLNVAQAAQWLAEGKEIQGRKIGSAFGDDWSTLGAGFFSTGVVLNWEYRLKPEPAKPGVVYVIETRRAHDLPWNRVQTMVNPTGADLDRAAHAAYKAGTGYAGATNSANLRVRQFVETEMP